MAQVGTESTSGALGLADVLSDLYHTERSGVLTLGHGGQTRRIHVDRGIMVFCDSTLAEEGLGELLVQSGKISTGALEEARATLDDAASVAELATTLIKRDLAGRTTISSAMAELSRSIVESAFSWSQCTIDFTDETIAESPFESDILTTIEVILSGVLRMAGFRKVFEAMIGIENNCRFREPSPIPVEQLTLSTTHGFILSRINGKTHIRDLISILPPEEEEAAARFLFGLLALRVIEYDPPLVDGPMPAGMIVELYRRTADTERDQRQAIQDKYDQIRQQNPYQILNVPTGAVRRDVERAYEFMKSQFARDRLTLEVRNSMRSQIAVIESRMVEAFLTLTQPSRGKRTSVTPATEPGSGMAMRVEMDRPQSKIQAEETNRIADAYFSKAKSAAREGDFHNSIQYGKLAISHNASDSRYYALLADCQVRNPESRWQRMAEENYRRATQLDPWNPEYWLCLARLYKRAGMATRARRNFDEALKLVANKADVLAEMADLGD